MSSGVYGAERVTARKQIFVTTSVVAILAASFAAGQAEAQTAPAQTAQAPVTEYLLAGDLPPEDAVSDGFGYASGALRYDLDLLPGSARDVYLATPFGAAPWPCPSGPGRDGAADALGTAPPVEAPGSTMINRRTILFGWFISDLFSLQLSLLTPAVNIAA